MKKDSKRVIQFGMERVVNIVFETIFLQLGVG
jgi:hypothetical protein